MHEKDSFGDKLKDKERGEEEQFFAERERALFDKLREQDAGEGATRPKGPHRCPRCGNLLTVEAHADCGAPTCPTCR